MGEDTRGAVVVLTLPHPGPQKKFTNVPARKNIGITSDALPGFLWVETVLAVPAVALGLVPWLLVSTTELRAPTGFQTVWLLAGLALVLLWLVLVVHLVVTVPGVLHRIASKVADGPSAHGMAAIGGLFLVMGVLAAIAVVVVLHAGWLLGGVHAAPTSRE